MQYISTAEEPPLKCNTVNDFLMLSAAVIHRLVNALCISKPALRVHLLKDLTVCRFNESDVFVMSSATVMQDAVPSPEAGCKRCPTLCLP